MGNFYTNITLKGPGQQEVAGYLKQTGRRAFVSPTANNCTVVFDQECDEQDMEVLRRVAADLSRQFDCAALAVLNHDDDLLLYQLHQAGELLDEYNSCPAYFEPDADPSAPDGGDAHKLCAAFEAPPALEQVESILHRPSFDDDDDKYVFAVHRHLDLARALRLPTHTAGSGYDYLAGGEFPEGLDPSTVIRTW